MKKTVLAALVAVAFGTIYGTSALATGALRNSTVCALHLLGPFPARASTARSGSGFVKDIFRLSGSDRDARITEQVLAGNVPEFLRHLIPVTLSWSPKNGEKIDVTICVTPDYMAVGGDRDFVRVPMGLPAAARHRSETWLSVADHQDGRCDLCAGAGASGASTDDSQARRWNPPTISRDIT